MQDFKPTITTVRDVVSLVHNLRARLQDRNQDFRTISHAKALHSISEAKGYNSWQHYSAELVKHECISILVDKFDLHPANAEAAWNTLSSDAIRYAESASDLAEDLAHTYCSVPINPEKKTSKEANLNQAMVSDFMDVYERLGKGENVDDLGVYGAKVSGIEICLVMGSSSNLFLLVDENERVLSGRLVTDGLESSDTLELDAHQINIVDDLFSIEIGHAIAQQKGRN